MKKSLLFIFLFATNLMAQPPQRQAIDADETGDELYQRSIMGKVEVETPRSQLTTKDLTGKLKTLSDRFVQCDQTGAVMEFVVSDVHSKFKDNSFMLSFPELASSYFGVSPAYAKKVPKFNPKKDNINNFRLGTINQHARIVSMLNKRGNKALDMYDFGFVKVSENVKIEDYMNYQEAVIQGEPMEYLTGALPREGEIGLKHLLSAQQVNIPYKIEFGDVISWNERDGVFLVELLLLDGEARYCHVTELLTANSWYLKVPFTIFANGMNGRNGRNGLSGTNGINKSTYTDKKGVTHTINGTCGTRGGNGENGTDGGNGGTVLLYLDDNMLSDMVRVNTAAGLGGKGGRGGSGGVHGVGSGCLGVAPRGLDGRDGSNGKPGESAIISVPVAQIKAASEKLPTITDLPYLKFNYPVNQKKK